MLYVPVRGRDRDPPGCPMPCQPDRDHENLAKTFEDLCREAEAFEDLCREAETFADLADRPWAETFEDLAETTERPRP